MIWSEALVTLSDGKTLCRIEDLQIGQSLLNPLTGERQEVTDILLRDPRKPDGRCPPALTPHRIAAESLGPGQPIRDIWLSPSQEIFASMAFLPGRALVTKCLAETVGRPAQVIPAAPFRFAAIFLDQRGIILADGLPVDAYHISVLDMERSALRV